MMQTLLYKSDQPADEQNMPVLKTRKANNSRPTCKPNFLQTALCKTNKQVKHFHSVVFALGIILTDCIQILSLTLYSLVKIELTDTAGKC